MDTLFVGKSPNLISYCKSHSHNCWEIVIPTFGDGILESKKQTIKFHPEMLYIVPPNTYHSSFSKGTFNDIFIHISYLPFDKNKITSIDNLKNLPSIGELIYSLYLKSASANIKSINAAVEFIVQLCQDTTGNSCNNSLAKEVQNFLADNISNPDISMKLIELKFKYNADYIRRFFKYEYGKTPMAYINDLRVKQAKRLLKNMSVYTVCQISEICGFTDALYFSRFFKKHTGISPKDFRKMQKK